MRERTRYHPRPLFRQPETHLRMGFNDVISVVHNFISVALIPFIVFIIALGIYLPVLQSGYVSNDYFYFPLFTSSWQEFYHEIILIFSGASTFPPVSPIVFLSFRLDHILWGDTAAGFHATNLVIHSLNAVLIFFMFRATGFGKYSAFAISLIFAVFAGHSETVNWISSRPILLSFSWLILSYLFWCTGRRNGITALLIISGIAFFLAITTKASMAAGLLAFPLLDWLLHIDTKNERGTGTGFQLKWYLILLVIAVVLVISRIYIYGLALPESIHWIDYLRDLRMLVTPVSRTILPSVSPALINLLVLTLIITVAGVTASLVIAILQFRWTDERNLARIIFGFAWIFIFTFPVILSQPVGDSLENSTLLYVPSIGLAVLFGTFFEMSWKSGLKWRIEATVILMLAVFTMGIILQKQNELWMESGNIVRQAVTSIESNTPQLSYGSKIYVLNFPSRWRGVPCAPVHLERYISDARGTEDVEVIEVFVDSGDIESWWADKRAESSVDGAGFYWDPLSRQTRFLGRLRQVTGLIDVTGVEIPPEVP